MSVDDEFVKAEAAGPHLDPIRLRLTAIETTVNHRDHPPVHHSVVIVGGGLAFASAPARPAGLGPAHRVRPR